MSTAPDSTPESQDACAPSSLPAADATARESSLRLEIEALRAENLQLRAQQALSQVRDELNHQIIASSPDCIKVLDLQGRLLQMTAQGCRLMDVDDFDQVRHGDWCAWWPQEGEPPARAAIERAARGETARFIAFGNTFKGTPKWWDNVVAPIRAAQGEPMLLLVVSRDVTELQQQQEQVRQLNAELEQRVHRRTEALAGVNARLQQALEQAQALYQQAPCGYHSTDGKGVFVAINDTALAWLGYDRDELVGKKTLRDLVLPTDIPLLEDRLQAQLRGAVLENVEFEVLRQDGSSFHALLSSRSVRDAQGCFLYSNCTLIDISARKAAELTLRDQKHFLQNITDQAPSAIGYLDPMLRFRFANAGHRLLYGFDSQKIIGLHLSECISAQAWAELNPRLQAALAGQAQHFESWQRTAEGQQIFVSIDYRPDIQHGQVRGLFTQIIDLTERKRIEQRTKHLNEELERRIQERSAELLASEQRFRLMVDNLRDHCIFFLDTEGRITDWPDSAQRLEAHTPTQMMGRHYALLLQHDGADPGAASADHMLALAAAQGQHERTHWRVRADQSRYWCHALLIALRDDSGALRGFAAIHHDMSDVKRLDDLMYNLNDELEQRVQERTAQLLAANQELESFSYTVSHDLRSPLRHVCSFVSLLEEHLGPQCDHISASYLSTISKSAQHMSALIDGLLTFSRLGRSSLQINPVDLTELVGTIVRRLSHEYGQRAIDWVIAPDLPLVQADALLLGEVWANLLDNACKYTRPRERARIEVGWSVDPAAGYTFFVRDNGVGFDTRYASKLFGVFQRLHRASEFEGTGIGLALSRRIIDRHGGNIWAQSQLGEGSEFSFSLPFQAM